jgi:hypothetical protein
MLDWQIVARHALIYSLVATAIVVSIMRIDNRIFFFKAGFPEEVYASVLPFTESELRRSKLLNFLWGFWAVGYPLLSTFHFKEVANLELGFLPLFLHAFLIYLSFWLVDLVLIDGIILCWITPEWVVIPGMVGFPGYKDFRRHLRGHFSRGLLFVAIAALLASGIVLVS